MASTMKDISKYTGLGLATVSSYFNDGNLREKNRLLIEKAIIDLNFELNETARSLRTKKSKTIGVIIPELNNIFCTTIIAEIEDILRMSGYATIVCDCRTNLALEKELVSFLLKKKVDGIINIPVCRTAENLQKCIDNDIPIVLIDRKLKGVNADYVIVDNVKASYAAIQLLIDNGHRKIGIITGETDIFTANERLLGYRNCLLDNHIPIDENLIIHGDYTVEGGVYCTKELISRNPDMTGVLVSNFEMTVGALIAFNEMDVEVPDAISFIGFDSTALARVTTPKMFVVSQPLEEIAKNAANLLLSRLKGNLAAEHKTVILNTSVIEGKSIKKINV